MQVDAGFLTEWHHKGHDYGECMSCDDTEFMYVHIPKNASSWTKPNLRDLGWEFFNYHTDHLNKRALVALRDPVERWVSGMAEYLFLNHRFSSLMDSDIWDLIFDRITFDDHTERQINFLHGLDTDQCVFLWCDANYRKNFSAFVSQELHYPNRYFNYEPQHVSALSPDRLRFKTILEMVMSGNNSYVKRIKQHFKCDYELISQVKFYGS
jgi:hypothetical protein